ncbi:MAG: adenosine deaminase, partial [Aeromicrobium sp.]
MRATPEQIAAAPKVALHEHLDGGVRPETVAEIAVEIGHDLPAAPEDLGRWFEEASSSGSLVRYLETFEHTVGVMQRPEDLARVAREAVLDLAADGVVYAELRWAPEQHQNAGLSIGEAVEAVQAGIDEGVAEVTASGRTMVVGQLLTAMRHAMRGLEIAKVAVEYRDRGVLGFDIAGAEDGFPPILHLEAFEYLRRENMHFTIHAGEAFGLPSIWQAVQRCGADRLGHGVRIVDDIDFTGTPHLGRLAAYIRDSRIPLEMCPS